MAVDAQGVMRMREIDGIALAPKAKLQMRPGTGMHLMLIGLKEPLKEGATFPMTLQFERAGTVEVNVVVQAPQGARRERADAHALSGGASPRAARRYLASARNASLMPAATSTSAGSVFSVAAASRSL